MAKVRIICGDFPQGDASLSFLQLTMPAAKGHLLGENINLVELEDIQIASAERVSKLEEKSLWPESLENVLRKFEASVVTANKKEIVFVGVFADGRKILASAKNEIYEKILNDWEEANKRFKREADKTPEDKERERKGGMVIGGLVVAGIIAIIIFIGRPDSQPTPESQPIDEDALQQLRVVDDAYLLCESFEATGLTTDCEVKGWGLTVDVRIDTSGSEARKICTGVADMLAQKTHSFASFASSAGRPWKLRIFSPYSSEHPIAICNLR